jgi:hypothetical protein
VEIAKNAREQGPASSSIRRTQDSVMAGSVNKVILVGNLGSDPKSAARTTAPPMAPPSLRPSVSGKTATMGGEMRGVLGEEGGTSLRNMF